MPPKRIAVIGGGPMGTATVKCLKEEDLEPVCFEKTGDLGGLWRYHDDDVEGLASVMKTTVINSSKEMTAISDFPPPDDAPNYMHNRQVYQLITKYAEKFDLVKHIKFHKEVTEVCKADDYDATGRLRVTVRDTQTSEVTSEVFEGVVVCIGHHVYPHVPSFPGQERFRGTVLHTHSLKKVSGFEDKVVVVVGTGNSGMDAAVEISAVAKQVYLSSRRGTWVFPRKDPSGLPLDIVLTRRYLDLLFQWLPLSWSCGVVEYFLNHRFFDHSLYGLKPVHGALSQHPTVSDTLPVKLLTGTVLIRKNIREFRESGVVFEGDEEEVTECDAVVLATGYNIKFPFLSEGLSATKGDNQVHLYKYVFPPHLKHPSLAFGGLIQSFGGGFPVGEAQARWITQVFKGNCSLPSRSVMEADIAKKKKDNEERYVNSQRHTIQVDYIPYLDEIYSLIGAKPNLLKILLTDPSLFKAMFFGPSLPYQYRLQGPHPWSGARQAILDWNKRVEKPLKGH